MEAWSDEPSGKGTLGKMGDFLTVVEEPLTEDVRVLAFGVLKSGVRVIPLVPVTVSFGLAALATRAEGWAALDLRLGDFLIPLEIGVATLATRVRWRGRLSIGLVAEPVGLLGAGAGLVDFCGSADMTRLVSLTGGAGEGGAVFALAGGAGPKLGKGGTLVLAITDFLNAVEGAGVDALMLSIRVRSLGVLALAARMSRRWAGSESFLTAAGFEAELGGFAILWVDALLGRLFAPRAPAGVLVG